ncbi:galactose mutarotase [Caballeronia sp. EK]|uniref:aldose epimerase family protein n=1 Tax=Caballeronia sp. EK TaxID=2767469 RepID=UPI0016558FD1|nr:galactose mutarotase [Caballeronia sp. EK]
MNYIRSSCLLNARSAVVSTILTCCILTSLSAARATTVSEHLYGVAQNGRPVSQYTLENSHGVAVKLITYGAIITEINVPSRLGDPENIVLGFGSLKDYETYNSSIHFGSVIGRYANRIGNGRFQLDGKSYNLPINSMPNTLHGGPNSFDTKIWSAKIIRGGEGAGVELIYVSPDGENGFPGKLTVRVSYVLKDDNALHIEYKASTDKTTVVNLTNHTYFNLAGEGSGSVENQRIQIVAARYTPTDSTSIPTGELSTVAGTPMDLQIPTPIGTYLRSNFQQLVWAHGYDHNWVLDNGGRSEPGFAARAYDPTSGRQLEIYTTEPGLQFYTSNYLDGSVVGSSGKTYRQTDGFALEAEHFPDSPNHSSFPSTELKPGEILRGETILRFSWQ